MIFDIFEYIRDKINCPLISDMRFGNNRVKAIIVLKQTNPKIIEPKQLADIRAYLGVESV